jgi:hypothetical protein
MSQNQTIDTPVSQEIPSGCPGMEPPTPQHQWLERFAGEWAGEGQAECMPGEPPALLKGTESIRMVGGYWMHCTIQSEIADQPYTQIMTMGYDAARGAYVGTVIDSMTAVLWQYEGSVDATGNVISMDTEGPFPFRPEPVTKFRDVTEFKSPDHKIFTSYIVEKDGSLTKLMSVESRRK